MQQIKIPQRVMILPIIDTDNAIQGKPAPAREPNYIKHLDKINEMNENDLPYGDIVRYVNNKTGDLSERSRTKLSNIVKRWQLNFLRNGERIYS